MLRFDVKDIADDSSSRIVRLELAKILTHLVAFADGEDDPVSGDFYIEGVKASLLRMSEIGQENLKQQLSSLPQSPQPATPSQLTGLNSAIRAMRHAVGAGLTPLLDDAFCVLSRRAPGPQLAGSRAIPSSKPPKPFVHVRPTPNSPPPATSLTKYLNAHSDSIQCANSIRFVATNSRYTAVALNDSSFCIYDQLGRQVHGGQNESKAQITASYFDDQFLVHGLANGTFSIITVPIDDDLWPPFPSCVATVTPLAVHSIARCGNYLAFGHLHNVALFRITERGLVKDFKTMTAHKTELKSLALTSHELVTTSAVLGAKIKLWSLPQLKRLTNVASGDKTSPCNRLLNLSDDTVLTIQQNGQVSVFSRQACHLQPLKKFTGKITAACSRNGDVAIGMADGSLWLKQQNGAFTHTNPRLGEITSLAIDSAHNLRICTNNSKILHQITPPAPWQTTDQSNAM